MEEEEFKHILESYLQNTDHLYKTTHTKLCFIKIFRIFRRVKDGYGPKFGDIKINESTNLIIDGNHRFIAYEIASFSYNKVNWCRNFSDVEKNISDIQIDYIEDWDYNDEDTRKYCNDDFLENL